jgi:hypothetical protein
LSITFIDTERIGCAEFCTVQIQNAHQEMGFCYKKRMQTEKEKGKGGRAELRKHFLLIALKEKLKPECWLPLKMVHRNASGTSISSNCVATPMRC